MEALAPRRTSRRPRARCASSRGAGSSVALAPRTQGEAMWRRFKTAQDAVFARTSAYMAEQHEARTANLQKKQALCERAEALSASSDWVKTAAELQALQARVEDRSAPVSRGHEKALWERFRAACDGFFSRRQEDLKKRKDEWSANLAQKEALCEEAERLAAVERLGRHRGAVQAPAGAVEEHRPGAPVEVGGRSGSASAPRATASSIATSTATRSRSRRRPRRAPSVIEDLGGPGRRRRGAETPRRPRASYDTVQKARARLAAGARGAARRCSRTWPCATTTCSAAWCPRWPARVCRHRPRSRQHAQADGEAAGARRGSCRRRRAARRRRRRLAGRAAGPAVARAPGREHHDRRPVEAGRGDEVARGRAGSAQRAAAVDAAGPGARVAWPARSTSASSAPAASSTTTAGARRSAPAGACVPRSSP